MAVLGLMVQAGSIVSQIIIRSITGKDHLLSVVRRGIAAIFWKCGARIEPISTGFTEARRSPRPAFFPTKEVINNAPHLFLDYYNHIYQ
jgi:hypothetical protein